MPGRLLAGYDGDDFEDIFIQQQLVFDNDLGDFVFQTNQDGNLIIKNQADTTLFTFGSDGTFSAVNGSNQSNIKDIDNTTSITTEATAETIIMKTNSSERLRIDSSGNTNITGDLTVSGTISGTIAHPEIANSGDTTSITTEVIPDTLIMTTNSTERLRITSSGDINCNNNDITNVGDISASTLTGTITTASQPNITNIGTLSGLNVSGDITTSGLYGDILTAAQPNITSLGTLTSLTSSGDIIISNPGDLIVDGLYAPKIETSNNGITFVSNSTLSSTGYNLISFASGNFMNQSNDIIFNQGGQGFNISEFHLTNINNNISGNRYFKLGYTDDIDNEYGLSIAYGTGYVGIGTTAPSRKVHIQDSSTGYDNMLYVNNTNATVGASTAITFGTAESNGNRGEMSFNYQGSSSANNNIEFGFYNKGNVMNITYGGNVGIGTSNPLTTLDVRGNQLLYRSSTGDIASYFGGSEANGLTLSNYTNTNTGDSFRYDVSNPTGKFHISNDLIDKMTITTAGVGIGTITPAHPLDVNGDTHLGGDVYLGTTSGADSTLYFGGGATGDNNYSFSVIESRKYAGTENTELLLFKGNDIGGGSGSGPDRIRLRGANIVFDTYATTSSDRTVENIRMLIQEDGKVGIGTTTPAYTLDVPGTISTNHVHRKTWDAGEIIKTTFLSFTSDLGLSDTTYSSYPFNLFSYIYTPGYATSKIIVEIDMNYTINGSGGDLFESNVYLNDGGVVSIAYKEQNFNSAIGGGARSSVMFPIMGAYTNSTTATKTIVCTINASTDDAITIKPSYGGGVKITEIAR